ncbi:DUF4383 domain-containing protein [Streptomyces sp. NBC_00879]|uniref:DUF4383 domain-containing protein n=1 Tax=Streptomyces sp. NBC_00879 TaxID=2975855 RepID=UPI00386D89A3|nr:DUF4383 domain-containing protein [Streptomyces sp. NBC_00879]
MAAHVPLPKTSRTAKTSRNAPLLDEHLPVDHRLNQVYRVGAGLMGLVLLAFGILGLIDEVGFFDTDGDTVAGLNTNGALSVLSICIGLLLFVGMVIGGNFASTLNMVLGIAFILSGFINLALIDTTFNPLAFEIQNVLFSFVVGVLLMFFGMYGRVSSTLPHDNPYWKARHPDHAAQAQPSAQADAPASTQAQEQPARPAEPGPGPTLDKGQGS